jgi:glucose/arabinose dehydrogenase
MNSLGFALFVALAAGACTHGEAPDTSGSDGGTTGSAMASGSDGTAVGGNSATVTGGVGSNGSGGAASGMTGESGDTVSGTTGGGTGNTIVPGTEGFDCAPPDGSSVSLKLTPLIKGLEAPTGIFGAPGETERLFVLLQEGRIEILRGSELGDTFLDLTDKVDVDKENQHEERGLLGMAFHPDFQANGKFFVIYTAGNADDGDLHEYVSEFTASGDVADPDSERVFLELPHPENNHNGGGMAIGLDGYLYISLGDGGWSETLAADLYNNGQNPSTLLGKILRLTLEGEPAPGNMPSAAPEVWDIGLRNPWRIASDGCTGDLYIADVGFEDEGEDTSPSTEEVNVEPAAMGHRNYGWPIMEGAVCREAGCDATAFVTPVNSYPTIDGNAIIGGHVYRGSRIPGLRGTYLYADYGMASFWAFSLQEGLAVDSREITSDINPEGFELGNIVSFGQDSTGEMYVIAWTAGEDPGDPPRPATIGDVYRIDPE